MDIRGLWEDCLCWSTDIAHVILSGLLLFGAICFAGESIFALHFDR